MHPYKTKYMYYAHKSFPIFKVKHMTNFEQLKKITLISLKSFDTVTLYRNKNRYKNKDTGFFYRHVYDVNTFTRS